jgi:Flp pilus assembly protein TadG
MNGMAKLDPIEAESRIACKIRDFMVGANGLAGAAILEFAVVATVVIVIFVAIMDFGMLFFRQMQVQHAAQAGAQWALSYGYSSSAISSAVTNATSFTAISATPAPSQFCGCPTSTGVTTVSAGACSSSPTCSGSAVGGTYVTVSAQATYNPIAVVKLGAIFTSNVFTSSSYTLTASATVRVQ